MSPAIEAYLSALEVFLLTLLPVLLLLTLYAWGFAFRVWRDWRRGEREGPAPRLPIAMALTLTVAGACATVLVWASLYRSRVGPIPEWAIPVQATAVFALVVIAYLPILYVLVVDILDRRGTE